MRIYLFFFFFFRLLCYGIGMSTILISYLRVPNVGLVQFLRESGIAIGESSNCRIYTSHSSLSLSRIISISDAFAVSHGRECH